jgi:hypothetical protein
MKITKNIVVGGNPAKIRSGDLPNTSHKSSGRSCLALFLSYGPNQDRQCIAVCFSHTACHQNQAVNFTQHEEPLKTTLHLDITLTNVSSALKVDVTRRYLHG